MCGLNIRHFSSIISLLILKTKQKTNRSENSEKSALIPQLFIKNEMLCSWATIKKMLWCRILMIIFFPECYLKSTCESVSAFFPELRMSVFVSRPSQDADLIWAHQKLGGPPPPPPVLLLSSSSSCFFFSLFKKIFLNLVGSFFFFFPKSASVFRFLPVMHVFSVGLLFVLALFFSGKQSFAFILLKRSPGFYWKQ